MYEALWSLAEMEALDVRKRQSAELPLAVSETFLKYGETSPSKARSAPEFDLRGGVSFLPNLINLNIARLKRLSEIRAKKTDQNHRHSKKTDQNHRLKEWHDYLRGQILIFVTLFYVSYAKPPSISNRYSQTRSLGFNALGYGILWR